MDRRYDPVKKSSPVLGETVDACCGFGEETAIVQYCFCIELVGESVELRDTEFCNYICIPLGVNSPVIVCDDPGAHVRT